MKTLQERFEEKVMPEPNTGCWLWTGSLNNKGYGRIMVNHANKLASRVSYELYRGPIGNLIVMHRCDNTVCVNPDHLLLGTMSDNSKDMVAKGRQKSCHHLGIKPYCKLTLDQVNEIRASNEKRSALARKFNVQVGTIRKIKLYLSWV
jgi:HNH endonuclease